MSDMYVVIDDKKYPDRIYWNEAPSSAGNEIMNLEDAKYTAEFLCCKVCKLVPLEVLNE